MTSNSLLIVDDSPYLHKMVRAFLEPDAFVARSVYDGGTALAEAMQWKPHLILLDVDLPEVDGFEVCRRLKASPVTTHTPVIFLTADQALDDKIKGFELGAVDYITKPFKPEELRARVRTALRTKQRIEQVAMIDSLTGLWNQAGLDALMPSHFSFARRTEQSLACIVAEVDSHEQIVHQHGAGVADEILQDVANIVLGESRREDQVFHLGQGSFVILMPRTTCRGAARWAGRVRLNIARQLMQFKGMPMGVTCSFGVADTQAEGNVTFLDQAEVAIVRARQSGGNTVSVARPVETTKVPVA